MALSIVYLPSIFPPLVAGGSVVEMGTLRPAELPSWGWDLPVGGGTYHALFPRAWQLQLVKDAEFHDVSPATGLLLSRRARLYSLSV